MKGEGLQLVHAILISDDCYVTGEVIVAAVAGPPVELRVVYGVHIGDNADLSRAAATVRGHHHSFNVHRCCCRRPYHRSILS